MPPVSVCIYIYIYIRIHIYIWLRPCFHRAPVLGQNLLDVDSVKLQIFPSRNLQLLVHVMKVDTRPLFHGGSRCVFCEVVTVLQGSSEHAGTDVYTLMVGVSALFV